MTQPHSTKALDWRNAKLKGQRLPEHELNDQFACDLCGEAADYTPDAEGAESVTGLWICVPCIEASLEDASTLNARSEVGLVGSGGSRS